MALMHQFKCGGALGMHISVIIPAHNAVETITDTLDSLLAQTFPEWEAIIVDDGSSDDTAALVARFAERDARIRLVQQSQRGVSAARNTGMSLARYDWLLFLDADDWLAPVHLARLTDLLLSTPDLDAACCNYARVAPDGTRFDNGFRAQSGDLFAAFARACIIAIHACIIRRSLVEAVGGFDPALRTCEDWDLWQRIARTGARFGVMHEVYAFYRMRPASASVDMGINSWQTACACWRWDTHLTRVYPTHILRMRAGSQQSNCLA